jgi:hypothetical protein
MRWLAFFIFIQKIIDPWVNGHLSCICLGISLMPLAATPEQL